MKKIIFKNFLRETTEFFILSSCAVTIIVWVIQAVNYLEFVTEDGHIFKIYFLFSHEFSSENFADRSTSKVSIHSFLDL